MKKQLPILLAFVLFACTLQLDEVTDSAIASQQLSADANLPAVMKRSHQFPFDSAALLVSDLLKIPVLNTMAGTLGGGGTFPASLFQVSPDSSGVILWHAYDASKKEIFLALEQLKSYDVHNMPKRPTSKTLYRPAFTFMNGSVNRPEKTDVATQLSNEVISKNGVTTIDNATLVKHMNSFDSLLNTMPDPKGEKYNQFLFSFFHDNRDGVFEKFLGQGGKNGYVRYYFGYDEHDVPNRIRVILIAANARGKNVTGINAGGRTEGGDGLTLQRSWPPPAGN